MHALRTDLLRCRAGPLRSHAVLTVHIAVRKKKGGELEAARVEGGGGGGGGAMTSKLNLVDLAGSEKSTTGASAGGAATLDREGCYINKSLTFLEQVCSSLRIYICFVHRYIIYLVESWNGDARVLAMMLFIRPARPVLVQTNVEFVQSSTSNLCS